MIVTPTLVGRSTRVSTALVVVRVVDAASGRPRMVRSASTTSPHAGAHVVDGGVLVLVGSPELALPGLQTADGHLDVRLAFDDAPALELAVTVPAGSILPYRPAAVAVTTAAVSLAGTVHAAGFPYGPVGGAEIAVGRATGQGPVLAGLRVPLAAEHPAGTLVQQYDLAAATSETALAAPAAAGEVAVSVQDATGFGGATGVLALGEDATAEHVAVDAVDAATGRLALAAPLRRSRPAGTVAQARPLGVAVAQTTLTRSAMKGDGLLALAAVPAAALLELPGPVRELRATGAVCDADGRWRLDGVRDAERLKLVATAPGFAATTLVYDVDYRRPNVIDLDLTT